MEIGRRRGSGSDSSSSRGSSPTRAAPKRGFSPPNSDDGRAATTEATTNNDADESPPPQAQPIIRQAMAFGAAKPPESIVTYEAAPPAPPAAGIFLPGQQVPIPPKPKVKKTGAAAKRPKKADIYPGQTTRFRINTYDPTPSSEPPINQGNGPYSSLYRGVTVPPAARSHASPATVTNSSNGGNPTRPTTSSKPTATSSRSSAAPRVSTQPRSQPPPKQRVPPLPAEDRRPPPTRSDARTPSTHSESQRLPPQRDDHYPEHAYEPPPSNDSSSTYVPSSSSAANPYYRHNYEADGWEREPSISPPPQRRPPNHLQASGSSRYQNRGPGAYPQSHEMSGYKRSKVPLSTVTLLIQDMRSRTTDHQLAEVQLHLRESNPRGGLVANVMEVAERLQSGPSRIDGPARVYTMRGKYRQFILRVSADNTDDFLSPSSVVILPNNTLDLFVEMLHTPGVQPPPPKIQSASWADDYDYDGTSDGMDVDSRMGDSRRRTISPSFDEYEYDRPPIQSTSNRAIHERTRAISPSFDDYDSVPINKVARSREIRGSRKRASSSTFDDYDGPNSAAPPHPAASKVARHDYDWEHSPRQRPRHTSPRSSTSVDSGPYRKQRGPTREHKAHQFSHPAEYESLPRRPPPSPSPPPLTTLYATRSDHPRKESCPTDEVVFLAGVEALVRKEQGYSDFFRAHAGRKNSDILKQYTFIMKVIKNVAGKKVDEFEQPIEEMDIIKAMKIDTENFLENCKETMHLVDLYGENAGHYHEPRVTQLIEDPKPAAYNANPHEAILRSLRDIDKVWKNGRREQPPPPAKDSAPQGSPKASRGNASRPAARPTKGQ